MLPIFLISNKPFVGKNLLALGLSLNLKERGYKVSYMKLIGKIPYKRDDKIVDEEACFIHEMLESSDPVEYLSPFVLTYQTQYKLFKGENLKVDETIFEIINKQKDKDILIIVGGDTLFEGYSLKIDSLRMIKRLNAKTLVVQIWEGETSVDDILGIKDLIENSFLGAIFNKVPPEQYLYVKETVVPYLNTQGIEVFGVFKKDKFLESITVRKLLEVVNGGIVCCEDKLDEFVENFLVGAMDPGQAFSYFLRVPNKAVITGLHRTDIQILAMETSTKCLILTGGLHADETVVNMARSKKVPIIVTPLDTFTTVDRIQNIMGKVILKEKDKALKSKEIIAKEFALDEFLKKIEL
ncbi:MAG: cobyrinic acid a,c-diamide synthase [Thermodesulfobacteriota bacterium]|nr:MAG: cobyrinic acid a,c-diamide synthase [Thermodesulfobacteriota bacterium]